MYLRLFAVLALLPAAAPAATSPFRDLFFEPNRGQADPSIRYVSRTAGAAVGFTATGPTLEAGGAAVRLRLVGANRAAAFEPLDRQSEQTSYILGADPKKWIHAVPHYRRLAWRGVYPGIDVVFYGAEGRLEYDFVVSAGADPSAIRIRWDGDARATLTQGGDLVFRKDAAQFEMLRPRLYQKLASGERTEINGGYRLEADGQSIRFEVGGYDRARTLVVDPVLTFSQLMGGEKDDSVAAITSSGDIVGTAASVAFSPGQTRGGRDVFAYIVPRYGTTKMLYVLGGAGDEAATSAVAGASSLMIGGWTKSDDFIRKETRSGADGFLLTLGRDNTQQQAAGILTIGGSGDDRVTALSGTESFYFAGETDSPDLALGGRALEAKWAGGKDVFAGSGFGNYGTVSVYGLVYYGGSGDETAGAVLRDQKNGLVVAGKTTSQDLPLVRAFRTEPGGESDAYLARFVLLAGVTAGRLDFATYLGGSGADEIRGLAGLGSGDPTSLYFAGTTSSTDLPAAGPGRNTYAGGESDGFVGVLDFEQATIRWLGYVGGSGRDEITAIGVRSDPYYSSVPRSAVVAGSTTSGDLALLDPLQAQLAGPQDAFVAAFAADGAPTFATYLGGTAADRGTSVAVSADNVVTVGGESESADFPSTARGVPVVYSGAIDGFAASFTIPLFEAPPTVWTGLDLTSAEDFVASGDTPAAALVTVASSDPSRVLVGFSPYSADKESVTLPLAALSRNLGHVSFFVTGVASEGTATVTISVSGAGTKTVNVRLAPAVIAMRLYSAASNATLFLDVVSTLAAEFGVFDDKGVFRNGYLRADHAPLKLALTNSNPGVAALSGTEITIPPVNGGSQNQITLTAKAVGETEIGIEGAPLPVTPSPLRVTVRGPVLSLPDFSVGKGLRRGVPFQTDTPVGDARGEVRVTSDDPARLCFATGGDACVGSYSFPLRFGVNAVALADSGTVGISYSAPGLGASGSAAVQLTHPKIFLGPAYGSVPFRIVAGGSTDVPVSYGAPGDPYGTSALYGDSVAGLQITSSDPKVATVSGAGPAQFKLSGVAAGQVTVTAAAPGFDSGSLEVAVTAKPAAAFTVSPTALTVGKELQGYFTIQGISATATIKVTSSDPGAVLLSESSSNTASGELSLRGSNFSWAVTVRAVAGSGSARITISSAGYTDAVVPVTLVPSGFAWTAPAIVVSAYSSTTLYYSSYALDPVTLLPVAAQSVRPGVTARPSASVTNADAGSVVANSGPLSFVAGNPGTTTVLLEQPAGFTAPRLRTELAVRVNPGNIAWSGSLFIGKDLQTTATVGGPSKASLEVRSEDPSRLLVSTDPASAGSTGVQMESGGRLYLQALAEDGIVNLRVSGKNIEESVFPVVLTKSTMRLNLGLYNGANRAVRTTTQSPDFSLTAFLFADTPFAGSEFSLRAGAAEVEMDVVSSDEKIVRPLTAKLVFRPGQSATASFPVHAVSPGEAVVRVIPPAGFAASESNRSIAIKVGQPTFVFEPVTLGRDLVVARELRLESGVSLPSTVVVTVASRDASVALVSLRPDQPGQSKISLPYAPNGPGAAFYVHGLANGAAVIAVTATGMDDSSFLATVEPASISMNRYFDKLFTRATADLYIGFQAMLRPGVRVSIPVRSSDPSVLEVESPAVIEAGNVSAGVKVTAVHPGSAVISIDPPEGMVAAPTGGSLAVTVEDPPVFSGNVSRTFSLGKDHQAPMYLSGGPEAVTIRSSDASKLLIGTGPAEAGRASVTVDGTKPSLAIYFQALSDSGSATVTFSAPGYTDVTSTVNLCPSAFQFSHSSATVTVGRTFDFQVRPVMACSSANAYSEVQAMRGGLGRTTVDLAVDKPGVGTVKPASVSFDAGASSAAFTFTAVGSGSAVVSVKPPAGFVAPNELGVLVVTVAP